MYEDEKQDKLIKGMVGLVAAFALGYYVLSGNFKAREWFTFLPPPPPPDTLRYHAEAMRQALKLKQYSVALSQAEWVLLRDKNDPEAIRTRATCLIRVGRFKEAEQVFRKLIQDNKKDIAARLALATALRGQDKNDKARMVLLRILRDPYTNPPQLDTARALLDAMDFRESLFADQPTPPPLPTPEPLTSPSPVPLARITINPPGVSAYSGVTVPEAFGLPPSPAPLAAFLTAPSPEPPVAAVTLSTPSPAPKATPESDTTNTERTTTNAPPLEIPAPLVASPSPTPTSTPTPRLILPATVTGTRRILPATLPSEPKKAPVLKSKKAIAKKRTVLKKKASPAPKKQLEERR